MAHVEWDFFLDLFSSTGSSPEGLTDGHRLKDASGFECRRAGVTHGAQATAEPLNSGVRAFTSASQASLDARVSFRAPRSGPN